MQHQHQAARRRRDEATHGLRRVLPDRLVLYDRGARRAWPLLPPTFDPLKTVAHVTLGLFAVFSPTNGQPFTAETVAALRTYQGAIGTAREAIGAAGLSAAQSQRQSLILNAAAQVTARALADGHLDSAVLTEFCRRVRPLVEANVSEAVAAYLDELNHRMTEGVPTLSTAQRAAFLVIVCGVHQARIDNAAMQYFNRLLHDPPTIAQRLMYAENVFDEAGALHLLGIHLMARRVGEAYFDDPYYRRSRGLAGQPVGQPLRPRRRAVAAVEVRGAARIGGDEGDAVLPGDQRSGVGAGGEARVNRYTGDLLCRRARRVLLAGLL